MFTQTKFSFFLFACCIIFCFLACNNDKDKNSGKKETINNQEIVDKPASENIKQLIEKAINNKGVISAKHRLYLPTMVNSFYTDNGFVSLWSNDRQWTNLADSLFAFIHASELHGLFPNDYHDSALHKIFQDLKIDSSKRTNDNTWSLADALLTDACLHIIKDLKYGRLFKDSTMINDQNSTKYKFITHTATELFNQKKLGVLLQQIAPKNTAYAKLQAGIKRFLDSMDRRQYTYVPYPFKRGVEADSLAFIQVLQNRLFESKCIDAKKPLADSSQLSNAIKCYQKKKGLKEDGLYGNNLIKQLNQNDVEKFKRIAITLDRFKLLPDSLPKQYIWVNLPGYYLNVVDADTIALTSKIICGKPETRTPLLTSNITDMVIYPTWTVPNSIITKQYLPKLKKNPNYLNRLGLKLKNNKGQIIDASSINWDKYSKGIPYKVMQSSGDNNALGIMKFNFDNEYAVYLHDTNQRYLFKNSARALSHGCVRVQEWDKLAYFIARNDSMLVKAGDTLRYTVDSIKQWLTEKRYRRIDVTNHIPLFITYFSCEGKDGAIKFYEDIYGEDKMLREKYFSNK
jgi:L,D-transpeptidase YcbB